MHDNFVDQTSAESPAKLTSTAHSIKQLTTQAVATFTIAQEYIDLASALSEAVPPIAQAVQEIMPLEVKSSDIATRLHLKEADTVVINATTEIVHQGNEQLKMSLQVIASDYRNMLLQFFAEPLRQSQMSFNVAHRLRLRFRNSGSKRYFSCTYYNRWWYCRSYRYSSGFQ